MAELVPPRGASPTANAVARSGAGLASRRGSERSRRRRPGRSWRHFEPAHVVLGLIALVIVVMLILIALGVTGR